MEKLLLVFERALVDVTNKVGVDINRAVTDGYYQHLVPFVCGLGPRKAQALVKKIGALVCSPFLKQENYLPLSREEHSSIALNSSTTAYLLPKSS